MSFNVFKGDRNQESVAYDLALVLAAKDPEVTTPEGMIERIAELLPACREITEKSYALEKGRPFNIPDSY